VYSRKTKNVQIPFKGVCAKYVKKFFEKLCYQVAFDFGFPKSYKMLKSNDWK